LRVAFWPSVRFWWREDRSASELVEDGALPEQLAAELWVHEVESARRDKEVLDASAYVEIRYEDLIADPRAGIRNILAFVGLPWTSSFESVFRTFSIEDRTEGYRNRLDAGQIGLIQDVTGPAAFTFGYLDRSA
jgi:hypothetical protein